MRRPSDRSSRLHEIAAGDDHRHARSPGHLLNRLVSVEPHSRRPRFAELPSLSRKGSPSLLINRSVGCARSQHCSPPRSRGSAQNVIVLRHVGEEIGDDRHAAGCIDAIVGRGIVRLTDGVINRRRQYQLLGLLPRPASVEPVRDVTLRRQAGQLDDKTSWATGKRVLDDLACA